jgi:hypothetical protein
MSSEAVAGTVTVTVGVTEAENVAESEAKTVTGADSGETVAVAVGRAGLSHRPTRGHTRRARKMEAFQETARFPCDYPSRLLTLTRSLVW